MKRRNFIQLTSSAGAFAMLPTEVFALFKSAGMTSCPDLSTKKIVLIQLAGANDGLNTVVPINQYDKYASLRPTIKLSNSGANGIINLDTTLSLQNQVGLHPSLTGFKSLYDQGFLRIIQGVGYPIQDKSHFKSTDLWLSGGDGTPANNYIESGWIGRFLENYYAKYINANFPLGIQLGSNENSLGFRGSVESGLSININGQDLSGFYSVINGLGGVPPANFPISEYGNLLRFILQNDAATNTSAQAISNSFNKGTNSVTYPNSNLSNQLKTVAKFISGGLQTKVYLVKLGGFDTHDAQVAATDTAHLGTHADLLKQLSEAVNSFVTDLNNQNQANDVVAVTFSEFGRKIGENGNLGTDHGEVAPMFVFGKSIQPGISGTNINLSEATLANNYQVKTVQHDYRRVFSTIMQDWFGAGDQTLDFAFFDGTSKTGFSDNKIPNLIKTDSLIHPSCYDGVISGLESSGVANIEIQVYPNPASGIVTISSTNNDIMVQSVTFNSIDGRSTEKFTNTSRESIYVIKLQNFSEGLYTVQIDTDRGSYIEKLIIKR
jgi:uncharacterized protein (DUF1501 family)